MLYLPGFKAFGVFSSYFLTTTAMSRKKRKESTTSLLCMVQEFGTQLCAAWQVEHECRVRKSRPPAVELKAGSLDLKIQNAMLLSDLSFSPFVSRKR